MSTTTMRDSDPKADMARDEMDKPLTLKELSPILDLFKDQEKRFGLLCSHLGIEIVQNYEKFRIVDYRRGINPTDSQPQESVVLAGKPRLTTKKWYQFWK